MKKGTVIRFVSKPDPSPAGMQLNRCSEPEGAVCKDVI